MSENTETAILAGGCFWPAQELLRHRDGVISTRVGYTGGKNDNPTAGNHPGHAEAVEVIFDPARTSYRAILEFFFQIHRPDLGEERVGSDYRSEIFYTSDEQRQVAGDTIADADASGLWPGKVVTKISEAGAFWEAEAEDQDYLRDYPESKNQFSAWMNDALRLKTENDRRLQALDDFLAAYEAEHGEITEDDIRGAARRARERAVVVRGRSEHQGSAPSGRGAA